jgi:hypothetical protein
VAGLSVSGPTVRVTTEAVARLGPLVRDAAARVTHAIAGRLAPPDPGTQIAAITDANRHDETEFGRRRGREVW